MILLNVPATAATQGLEKCPNFKQRISGAF